MSDIYFENHYINYAKFIQNLLIENNIKCYLIGGSLINAIRDDGKLKSNDIDFTFTPDNKFKTLEDVLGLISNNSPIFSWHINKAVLSIFFNLDKTKKIDINLFVKRHLNYYLADLNFIHEKICHFQTFRTLDVKLENKNFTTMYRPDLFLKTVYGDYSVEKSEYGSQESGNTLHLQECIFYTDTRNYTHIDAQVENMKNFFPIVKVKRDITNINNQNINIFDDCFSHIIDKTSNIFYDDFLKFMVQNNIEILRLKH